MEGLINLRSDTVTTPSPEMRRAMYDAEVGDDYHLADPTVRALEEKAAVLLGKEAAILVLSGTMGNLTCVLAQANRGDSVILEETSHIFINEAGGMAALGALLPRTVKGTNGFIESEQLQHAIFQESVLHPPTRLVCIENTHAAAGGRCLSVAKTDALCRTARDYGLNVHLDGARIFNAAVAQGVSVQRLVERVDSITFCLTKGLGCPVGSIVAGSGDLVARVRHRRQLVGGGMRQAGVFAAAGLVALDGMIDRLADDHARARQLAEALAEADMPLDGGLEAVETNMVFVDFPKGHIDPRKFVRDLGEAGVEINPPKGRRIRFVTHYQVGDAEIAKACDIIRRVYDASVRDACVPRAVTA